MKNKKFKKAFTLVEMLIVVIIIGILMGALLPKLKGAQERARDTARKANLSTISTALEMYFNDYGVYPTGQCINDIEEKLVPTYVSELPHDPQKGRIAYGTKAGGCSGGVYAYTSLFRKGSQNGGAVTIANIEAQGSVGNFILPQNGGSPGGDVLPIFSGGGDTSKNAIGGVMINGDDDIDGINSDKLKDAYKVTSISDSTDVLSDASFAEKFTCSKTKLVSDGAMLCNRVKGLSDGSALVNNAMVYVIFN